jgi:Protein of unknown function (DUF3489)
MVTSCASQPRRTKYPQNEGDGVVKVTSSNTPGGHFYVFVTAPSFTKAIAIVAATGWQAHSVRGFISGHLVKKLGLRVKSFRQDGERVYAIKSR